MAAIRIPIISDFNSKGIEKAVKQFEQLKTTGEKAQFALQKAAIPAGLAIAGIGAFLVKAAKGAEEARQANQKLGNVLSSMGFAEATNRVAAFAESLEKTVAVDADVIKATQTVLATFSGLTKTVNEAGGAFDRATVAALDLAAAGFGTAESNAVQLGKALQDPIKGLAALAKSGVSFTESEQGKIKALVESNQLLAAQDIILRGIEKQVGGTAAASASSFDKMRFSLAGIADTFGEMVLPAIDKFAVFLERANKFVQENKTFVAVLTIAVAALATTILLANVAIKAQAAALVLMKVAAAIATAVNFALATSITAVQVATGVGIGVVLAAAAALVVYRQGQKKLQGELDESIKKAGEFNEALDDVADKTFKVNAGLNALARQHKFESEARLASVGSLDKYNEAAKRTTTSTGAATKAVVEFASKVKDGVQAALDTAKDNLATAQQVFTDFAASVSMGVKAGLSFADAFKLIDDNGKTFIENLREQVAGIKTYAANLQTLLERGLSQDALKYVLEAGGEAGAGIAAELVKGTTDLITGPGGINEMVAAAQTAADAVGMNAATRWYQAGVDQAAAIVDGIDAQLQALTPKLMARMDKIAAGLKRTVDVTVRIKEVVERIVGGAPVTPRPLVGASGMATSGFGGTSPFRQNNSQTVNVNVMGGLSTSAEIGQAVVNAIRAYNRSAGPANIAVA
jgi:hypothetical protein